jgi:hypothetical protein
MEFIKKNYEKVVLGVVLLGLTVAVCLLPIIIHAERERLDALIVQNKPHPKPLPPVDMTVEDAAFQRAETPLKLDFTTKHNLFNPVLWRKNPDGTIHKVASKDEEGADKLEVTAIKPLYLILSYGSQSGSGYFINIERQTALTESARHTQNFASKENKGALLSLNDVKGPPEKPTEVIVEWKDTGELLSLTPDKPFKRVEGYSADLKYPLEAGKVWTDQRVGGRHLSFANGYYKIVAITESNVVVSAESNGKKTTITFHPATEPR